MYFYGNLINLDTGSHSEGYFQENPTVGDTFVLHGAKDQGDIKTEILTKVVMVQKGHPDSFLDGVKPGDFLMETSEEMYLLKLYHLLGLPTL